MSIAKSGRSFSARRLAVPCSLLAGAAIAGMALAADTTTPKKTTVTRTFTTSNTMADFVPGVWTDGVDRHISDYHGKIVLVFSFDPSYIDSPQSVRKKLEIYDLFRDKPVAFLGVVNGHRDINMTKSLLKKIDVNDPMYIDNIGQMSSHFGGGFSVYLRMIDADGRLSFSSVTPQEIDAALKDVKWKYKDAGYDKKLDAIVDLLEWNHFEQGLKQLKPLRKSLNKELAASAEKLYQDVHAEGEKWKADAEGSIESDPVKSFDLYTKLAAAFPGEDLGKDAAEPLKKLKANKAMQDELAARDMFSRLYTVIPRAKYEQRIDVANYCDGISKKYPATPTGKKAKALYGELMNARMLE